jgi:hypothetical protein
MVYIACYNILTIGIDLFEIHINVTSNFVFSFTMYFFLFNVLWKNRIQKIDIYIS